MLSREHELRAGAIAHVMARRGNVGADVMIDVETCQNIHQIETAFFLYSNFFFRRVNLG